MRCAARSGALARRWLLLLLSLSTLASAVAKRYSVSESRLRCERVVNWVNLKLPRREPRLFRLCNKKLPLVTLRQEDFDSGMYVIKKPGRYELAEDIEFGANTPGPGDRDAWNAGFLSEAQLEDYDRDSNSFGFFAAIAVQSSDVIIDLKGRSIQQTKSARLLQRFFALIELNSSPFIKDQGAADIFKGFNDKETANNVCIQNGKLLRSSHHGIHGNGNKNIVLRDLEISQFEVAGIQLNGPTNVIIQDVDVGPVAADVPVAGTFFAAKVLRPYLEQLSRGYQGSLLVHDGVRVTPDTALRALRNAVNDAYDDVIIQGKATTTDPLFTNPSGLPLGSSVTGVIIHALGAAAGPFQIGRPAVSAYNIIIRRLRVSGMKLLKAETPLLPVCDDNGNGEVNGQQTDPVMAAFRAHFRDLRNGDPVAIDPETEVFSSRSPLHNAQLLIAKAMHDGFEFEGLSIRGATISERTVEWAETGDALTQDGSFQKECSGNEVTYTCAMDQMAHVGKGAIGLRIDGVKGALIHDVSVSNLTVEVPDHSNESDICSRQRQASPTTRPMSTPPCWDPKRTDEMRALKGFSISAGKSVILRDSQVDGFPAAAVQEEDLNGAGACVFGSSRNVHVLTLEGKDSFCPNGQTKACNLVRVQGPANLVLLDDKDSFKAIKRPTLCPFS